MDIFKSYSNKEIKKMYKKECREHKSRIVFCWLSEEIKRRFNLGNNGIINNEKDFKKTIKNMKRKESGILTNKELSERIRKLEIIVKKLDS